MFKYKIVQGIPYPIRAYQTPAVMLIQGQNGIVQFNGEVDDDTGELWINVEIEGDNYLEGGLHRYQIFQDGELKQDGTLQIVPSLLANPNQDLRSKYKVIVDAIQARLAGTATKAQKDVTVGDKKIGYMSPEQLIKVLNYFKGKLEEEEAENNVNPKTDQMRIKYVWGLR